MTRQKSSSEQLLIVHPIAYGKDSSLPKDEPFDGNVLDSVLLNDARHLVNQPRAQHLFTGLTGKNATALRRSNDKHGLPVTHDSTTYEQKKQTNR